MREPRLTSRQRQAVFLRASGCCEYCRSQEQYSPSPFSVKHIIPKADGGENDLENLALSCSGCNGHKYSKTSGLDPVSRQDVPLFHPRQDRWRDHFEWSDDFLLVIGLTPTGRATVETLHLNRINLINFRRVLVATDRHPPPESE